MLSHQENRTWQEALVARHPAIFNLSENGQTYAPGCPECGDGWRDLIETAAGRITDALAAAPSGSVTIVQTKEKFGTLRLYWHGKDLSSAAEHAIEDAVALAEARSGCTCEVCGRPGVLHARGDWLATACPDHARGEPVPIVPGFENLHIVRVFGAGRYPIASCRRYDRETDSFVDVDPRSLGIEE
jgi:hypothetical protein